MKTFAIKLTCGSENPSKVIRCFQFAKVCQDKGHKVLLFLVDDAVNLSKQSIIENLKVPTGDELLSYVKSLMDNNLTVLLCPPCSKAREIDVDNLPTGWKLGGMPAFIDFIVEEDATVLVY